MKLLKLASALIIVALGQGNILAINHQKLKPLPQPDSKKVSSMSVGKQSVSKLPVPKKWSPKNNSPFDVRKAQDLLPTKSTLVANNFDNDFKYDWRQPRIIWPDWFGCCRA